MRYIALVDAKGATYGVVMLDLPGCTSGGRSIDEALQNATEAVRLWAQDALADQERLPVPRDLETIKKDPKVKAALARGAALAVVPLILDSGRAAKANISLDSGLLSALDEAAAARKLTRSAFIASAVREKIETEG